MTKLKAPFNCVTAKGTLRKCVTFCRRGKRAIHATAVPAPKITYTRPQLSRRTFLQALARAWNTLPAIWQASWQMLATAHGSSLYHAYLRWNSDRYNQELWPIATTAAAVLPDVPVIAAAFAAGPRRLSARPAWAAGQKPVWVASMWTPPNINPDRPSRITCWSAMYPSLARWCHESRVPAGTYRYYTLVIDAYGRASVSKNGFPLVVEP
jgi:hypothetical protein